MTVTTLDVAGLPPEWQIDAAEFPVDGTTEDALRFCLRYAVLAPSAHNTQPWRVVIDGATARVIFDCARSLTISDPDDREGVLSVGAFLFNLRVASARFGLSCDITAWPEPKDPECCATVRTSYDGVVEADLVPLFDAITLRRTNRQSFGPEPLPGALVAAMQLAADAEGADLCVVTDYPDRRRVAELVGEADRVQMHDHRFRRELASWLRIGGSHSADGIQHYPLGHDDVLSGAAPLVIRTFDLGAGRAARDHELAAWSPVLALLTTDGDERADWLAAGQALERVLLRATAAGVAVGFLDQPIEVAAMRPRIADAFGTSAVPHVLLRLGYAPLAPAQRRRPLSDVLVEQPVEVIDT